jgi:hypothetical protein
MTNNLIEIQISSPTWGNLNGHRIYVTLQINQKLTEEQIRGESAINLFKTGKLLKGFKHLVEAINFQNPENKIILTTELSHKVDNTYFINYDDYRKAATKSFFPLYREIGIKNAKLFLSGTFPESFNSSSLPDPEIPPKLFERSFNRSIQGFLKNSKNRGNLYEQTSKGIKKLRETRKKLKEEIKSLEELRKESNIAVFQIKIDDFVERLKKRYPETSGDSSWQKWIYANTWLFGVKYQAVFEKEKVGFDNLPDFLFLTHDGFLDILEIKLPQHDVIDEDSSHHGSYKWTSKSAEAIGQAVNYLHEMELNQLQIQQKIREEYHIDVFTIKPRAFILIGNSEDWEEKKIKALRKLNYSLHGIEVLSYSDLKSRGQNIIKLFNELGESKNLN